MTGAPQPKRWRWPHSLLAVLMAVLAVVTITITTDDNGTHVTVKRVVDASPSVGNTVPIDTADPDNKPDTALKLTPSAQAVAQSFVDHPKDLTNAGPVPLSGPGVQKNIGEVPFPMAADELPPCRTRFLHTNFSTRSVPQSSVIIFELHYTAGPDIPNSRSDVDGLTAFGDRASSRVSWHINADKDGNCDYNVPLRMKAWTIAGLNSYTINIEVAGRGEPPYLRPGGYRMLARLYKQIHAAYPGVTLRLASTDGNCHPIHGGIDTHWRGGPCSGGHSDIKPNDINQVIATLATYVHPVKPVSVSAKKRCRELYRLRPWNELVPSEKRRHKRIRASFRKWHVKCVKGVATRRAS